MFKPEKSGKNGRKRKKRKKPEKTEETGKKRKNAEAHLHFLFGAICFDKNIVDLWNTTAW